MDRAHIAATKNKQYYLFIGFTILLIFSSTIALFGWFAHIPTLIQIVPTFVPMQFNSALCFMLAGISLLLLLHNRLKVISFTIGLFILLIGSLTLVEYVLHLDLRIDQLFMHAYITTQTAYPGRMAPNTALCFFLMGSTVILLSSITRLEKQFFYLHLPIFIVGLLGALSLTSYILDIRALYGWGYLTRMALLTSTLFTCWSGAALLLLQLLKFRHSFYSRPNYIPAFITFFTLSVIFIALWQVLALKERSNVMNTIKSLAPQVEQSLNTALNLQAQALERIAYRWGERGGTPQAEWLADTKNYLQDTPALLFFLKISSNGTLDWQQSKLSPEVTLKDYQSNLSNIQSILAKSPAFTKVILPPQYLPSGEFGSWLLFSLPNKNGPNDYLAIFYQYTFLFKNSLSPFILDLVNVDWQYQDKDIYHSIKNKDDPVLKNLWAQDFNIFINQYKFTLQLWPTKHLFTTYLSWAPALIIIIGLLIASLSAIIVQLYQYLSMSKEHNTMILDSIGEGIYGLNKEGRTTFFNPTAVSMLGYHPNELYQKIQHHITHHSYADGTPYPEEKCLIHDTIHRGHFHEVDTEVFWRKDGTSFPVQYRSRPIYRRGEIIGAVVSFDDITERKKLEAKIKGYTDELEFRVKERTAELQASNNELEAFCYSVAHDLRAPLRHIIGFIDLLEKNPGNQLSDSGKHQVDVISKAAQKLGILIDDLLEFSRAGRQQLNKEKLSLTELIEETKTQLQHEMDGRDVTIQVHALPEVYADKRMIGLVILNILGNALKFTRTREKTLIEVKASEDLEQHVFSISDNGVGFDPTYRDKIFLVFQRLHKASEFEGTGIGLANVSRIIQRHGGNVYADSVLGKGTTIYFTLPKKESKKYAATN